MIIDLDAHQGNGHEKDFSNDSMRSYSFTFIIYSSSALFDVACSDTSFWCFVCFNAGRVYILDMYNPDIYPLVGNLIIYS